MEKPSEIIKSSLRLNTTLSTTNCRVQSFLKHFQGQELHHLPEQSILMFNCSFHEGIPPDAQPTLAQLEASSVTGCPKSLTSTSLHPPFRQLYRVIGSPPSLLFSRLITLAPLAAPHYPLDPPPASLTFAGPTTALLCPSRTEGPGTGHKHLGTFNIHDYASGIYLMPVTLMRNIITTITKANWGLQSDEGFVPPPGFGCSVPKEPLRKECGMQETNLHRALIAIN